MAEEQTPQQPQQPVVTSPASVETDKEAKTMAMLCHLLALIILFVGPLAFIGPLIIWLLKKDEYPFVDEQGKESVNFQLTVLIAMVATTILGIITCGFGFILLPVVAITDLVFCIIATIKANNGEHYRYPVSWRLIK